MANSLKQKVAKGAVWALVEQFCSAFVGFAVSMVLARLLTPDDYGTVAVLNIFIALAVVLTDSGFMDALIQKKNATDLDFNSVFYLNQTFSVVLYTVLFFAASPIARFYGDPVLKPVLRVISVTLFFHAVNAVQNAELSRKLLFHLSFKISLIGAFTAMAVGISLAYMGAGAWALVWSRVAKGAADVIARWFIIAWRPRLMFSFHALRGLFQYGWKISLSKLLDTGYSNLYGLLVGKFYSKADLAYIQKGRHAPSFLMGIVQSTIERVSFPALAQMQNEPERVREAMRRMIQCSTYLVFPFMTIMAFTAPSLVVLLYGNQWHPSIPFMQIVCFSFALRPFHAINLKAIQALGRSDLFLVLEIIKKGIGLTFLLLFFRKGLIVYALISAFASGPLGVIINSWPNRKLLRYSIEMQLLDVLPALLLCIPMAASIYFMGRVSPEIQSDHGLYFTLSLRVFFQTVIGILVYIGLSLWKKPSAFLEYVRAITPMLKTKLPTRLQPALERFLSYLEIAK